MAATTILVIGALAALLLGGKKKAALPGGPYVPEAFNDKETEAARLLTIRKPVAGGSARYWRDETLATIALKLANFAAVKVFDGVFEGSRVVVFRIVGSDTGTIQEGTFSGYDALTISSNAGAATLVSLQLWGPPFTGPGYLVSVSRDQRQLWTDSAQSLAVLSDGVDTTGTPGPKAEPGGKEGPSGGPPAPWGAKGPKGDGVVDPYSDAIWPYDLNMDLAERKLAVNMLSSNTPTADDFELSAYAAEHCDAGHGPHPKLAKVFHDRAQALGGPTPTSFPYTIKADGSDWPFSLAESFTGNGNRWKELLPLNPGLKVSYVDDEPAGYEVPGGDAADGQPGGLFASKASISGTQVTPWNKGQVIQLPISWKGGK